MWREKLRIKKNNAIAGLYPFAKLWITGLYCFTVVVLSTARPHGYPVYMMAAFTVPVLLAAASGIFRRFLGGFRRLLALSVIVISAQAILFPGPAVLWSANMFGALTVRVYESGLQKGLELGLFILDLGGIFLWFFCCTENRELVCAFEKKGMSPKAGYVLLSTLKMIPALRRGADTVMSAQEARGVEIRGSFASRLRALAPSLVPLVVGAVNSAGERALALEAKGFLVRCQKTRLFDVRPNGKERLAVALAAFAAMSALVWRILLWAL